MGSNGRTVKGLRGRRGLGTGEVKIRQFEALATFGAAADYVVWIAKIRSATRPLTVSDIGH